MSCLGFVERSGFGSRYRVTRHSVPLIRPVLRDSRIAARDFGRSPGATAPLAGSQIGVGSVNRPPGRGDPRFNETHAIDSAEMHHSMKAHFAITLMQFDFY